MFPPDSTLAVLPSAARSAFSHTAIEESDGYYAAFKAKLCERLQDASGAPLLAPGALAAGGAGGSGDVAHGGAGGAAVAAELRAMRAEIAALRRGLEALGGAAPA
jgi:hypothetical protein